MNLLIFLSFLTLISADPFSAVPFSCPGITYTIPADSITHSYTEAFAKATKEIKNFVPKADGHVIFEPLKIHFNLTDINCSNSSVVDKFKSITIKDKEIEMNTSALFNATYSVKYSFSILGINLLYGTAEVSVKAGDGLFVQEFIGGEVKTSVKSQVTITPTKISSLLFSGGISYWIKEIANKGSLTGPLRIIEKSIDKEVLEFYSKWVSYEPFKRDNLQLVFNNELNSIRHAEDLVSFCMRTKIGIKDRPYNKIVYHHEPLPELAKGIKGRSCISFGVIAGTLDVYGKARDKMFSDIDADDLNIRPDVDAFIQTMPSLRTKYSTMKDIRIGCRSNSALSIMKIRVGDKNKMQIPVVCYFGEEDGDNLITIEFVVRSDYTYVSTNKAEAGVEATITKPELYSISHNTPARPVEDEMSLQKIARAVTSLLEGEKFFNETISAKLNFGGLKLEAGSREGEQICFTYT